ncbi:MAG: response regulator transcription factor [Gammaproteobacteria bacterium]|nr:response regulator transcription factor [Gammaproteobacteria bacterium]MDH5731524.1 response regulator transcription factor [Gammaproteobacteria bacterium]
MRLLLVEDDEVLSKSLKKDLQHAGFAVDIADNGVDGEYMGEIEPYDVIILDLGLPQKPGLEVLKSWREKGKTMPVLILTARDAWHEKVDGFQAGADDYLAKPFHVEELKARLGALIRRRSGQASPTHSAGGFVLDEDTQTVTLQNAEQFQLTGTEFRLLRYFMLNPGKILSKSRLTEHVYDFDSDKDSNVIEVYVKRLRQKLGQDVIQTRRGQGYVFNV